MRRGVELVKKISSKNGIWHIGDYENSPGKFSEGPNQAREDVVGIFLCLRDLLLGVQNESLGTNALKVWEISG